MWKQCDNIIVIPIGWFSYSLNWSCEMVKKMDEKLGEPCTLRGFRQPFKVCKVQTCQLKSLNWDDVAVIERI